MRSMGPPHLTDLRGMTMVAGAGHWVQQEAPEEVNAALLQFLGRPLSGGYDRPPAWWP